jgi:hypothetical protein
MMNLRIRRVQRLLRVEKMKAGQLGEIVAVTPHPTDAADFVIRAKRSSQ